jgi:copper transporter 1
MAFLASLSAHEIISLTSDGTKKEEMQEESVKEIDDTAVVAPDHIPQQHSVSNDDDDGPSVPFCTSGSMHGGATFSYLVNGGMNSSGGGGGGGMIMYMDGFRFSLQGGQPCLNLYLESWTLDTRSKFLVAMACVALLGIATEYISKLRSRLCSKRPSRFRNYRLTIAVLHGLQALVGYILMLATMTFSVELFSSVILGLGIGYSLFYSDDDWHVTTNPCCNYMQDEANERNEKARYEIQLERERNEQEQQELEQEVDLFHGANRQGQDDEEEENDENDGENGSGTV